VSAAQTARSIENDWRHHERGAMYVEPLSVLLVEDSDADAEVID
jgi:hypothetical protein